MVWAGADRLETSGGHAANGVIVRTPTADSALFIDGAGVPGAGNDGRKASVGRGGELAFSASPTADCAGVSETAHVGIADGDRAKAAGRRFDLIEIVCPPTSDRARGAHGAQVRAKAQRPKFAGYRFGWLFALVPVDTDDGAGAAQRARSPTADTHGDIGARWKEKLVVAEEDPRSPADHIACGGQRTAVITACGDCDGPAAAVCVRRRGRQTCADGDCEANRRRQRGREENVAHCRRLPSRLRRQRRRGMRRASMQRRVGCGDGLRARRLG